MDYPRRIQCMHCRQILLPKSKEPTVICPGCTLESKVENSSKKYEGRSCDGREQSSQYPKKKIYRLFKSSDSSPKTPLTIAPSPLESLNSRPRKRAVLCGVTYNKRKNKLDGTINDVKNMRRMLMEVFGYQENGIVVLTEEETPVHIPTKKNIERAMRWLVHDCKRGDSLVFYFSGLGTRQHDFYGRRRKSTDGFYETICPVDFVEEGMIIDNDINSIIVKPLMEGVTLHAIVDANHSGTILDLKYKYNRVKKNWDDNIPPTIPIQGNGGLAICISACADDQVASRTTAFTGNTINGAITYVLTEFVRKHHGLTYGDLLDPIHEAFEDVNKNGILATTQFLETFYKDSLSQKPQLTSTEEFDVYRKQFRL